MAGPPPGSLLRLPTGPAGLVHDELGPCSLAAMSTTCQQLANETHQLRRGLRHRYFGTIMTDDHDGRISIYPHGLQQTLRALYANDALVRRAHAMQAFVGIRQIGPRSPVARADFRVWLDATYLRGPLAGTGEDGGY